MFSHTSHFFRLQTIDFLTHKNNFMEGNCLSENTLYAGTVTSNLPNYGERKYVGVSAPPWKKRYGNHKASFNNRKYGKCSALAKEVWQIKDKGGVYNINWGVIRHAAAYNPVSKRCNLCLLGKLYIAENTGESLP